MPEFFVKIPDEIDKLREVAEKDEPEGTYFTRISAKLLYELCREHKKGATKT